MRNYCNIFIPSYWGNVDNSLLIFEGDCSEIMNSFEESSIDFIFADPPYFNKKDGVTCSSGKMVSVAKGTWDSTPDMNEFNLAWVKASKRVLKKDGTIVISGTHRNIFNIGNILQKLNFTILNTIVWAKPAPPPNLSCKCLTHSHELIIWAAKSEKSKYYFDYASMKKENEDKQMKDIWKFSPPSKEEKRFGKYPAQKPEGLIKRIIKMATKEGDLVLDPFLGSGTTGVVCNAMERRFIGIDESVGALELSIKRLENSR